jgi:flagellar biosynthesis protein FliR
MASILLWLLVLVRTGAFLWIFPLFSGPRIPVRLRLALAAFLAMMIAPGLTEPVDILKLDLLQLILLLFKETTVGIFLGFISRLVFFTIQLAGYFISTEIGLQTSTLIVPTDPVPVDVPAAVLNLLAMMLFLSLDVHHSLIIAFQQSYSALPIGAGKITNALFDDFTLRVSKTFLLAIQIAAPLIAISFLLSVIMMMLGRAVPQMNVFFESFTIKLFGGLVVFSLTMNLAAQRISDLLKKVPHDVLEVGKLLVGG